ncbi:MAG: isoprenylcysteine carboxyl methyltransferase [Rhodospirillaceae bacterium]|nr:isoprenylcysteine carboxyl methyltransferase [Rhodospirillaceae bacterium]OUU21933.1 MAG: hypothetical protein CBB97_15700 [Candidatus Endolissoclinum sp. TMED37]
MFLNHKIPPPIVMLIFIGLIYGSTNYVTADVFPYQNLLSLGILFFGLGFMFLGVREFKKNKTTINPLDPEAASSLVTSGVFRVTRNPMYLGMSFILLATSLFHGAWMGLPLIILFVVYITLFQIRPEERAMQSLFGAAFDAYKAKVRQWI